MVDKLDQFKTDIAKFSGNYKEFLVIVRSSDGHLLWRSTDDIWAVGAANRYLASQNEIARIEERELSME